VMTILHMTLQVNWTKNWIIIFRAMKRYEYVLLCHKLWN
jgi:hypothetical protein